MIKELLIVLAIGILIIVCIICLVVLIITLCREGDRIAAYFKHLHVETPQRKAGRLGERFANQIISEILRPDDILLSNVGICTEGRQTELDSVIINARGVFIIEVKNWAGEVFGSEDDHEWIQNKETYPGNIYQKSVKNPIGQVKREIYLLSKVLEEHRCRVWVEGYVFFVQSNSPVKSEYVVWTREDIDHVIHYGRDEKLSKELMDRIVVALGRNQEG